MAAQLRILGGENPTYLEVFGNFSARIQNTVFRLKGLKATPLLIYGQIESDGEGGERIGHLLVPKRHFQIAVYGLRENQRRIVIILGILDLLPHDLRNILFSCEILYPSADERLEGLFTTYK
jgi:hypothetical protein